MDLTGYLLGNRYEIIEKIGDGGMAIVYKARCRLLNRYVAVKVLKEEFINDIEFTKKFTTEAQAVASLSHPNIVSVYDVGREGNINYIVMELVQGKTLKEYIKQEGKIHWKQASEIAYQIAQALEHAHKNHIIHRDIKPHNIIITDDLKIKVTDFGIAKAVTSSTITVTGSTMGSVHYFSPEQAKGGITTEQSDIYSLGVVLYEMLTGILPFNGDSPVSVALKHVQENPKAPSDIEITVPYSISNIVMKAMQKDTNLRYQNVSNLSLDLSMAIQDPSKSYAKVENYDEFKTQVVPKIKDEQMKIERVSRKEEKIAYEKRSEKKEKIENMKKKKKKKILFYSIVSICGLILFSLAFIVGLYVTGALNRAKDVLIPDITNKTIEEATQILNDVGLKIKIEAEINSTEYENGYIISQSPNFPMKTKKGNEITVVVSKGPTELQLPDFTNVELEEVVFKIQKLGLEYEVKDEISLEHDKGIIIRQEPTADTIVQSESKVILYVSIGVGEGKVKMPQLEGASLEVAKVLINENNLVLKDNIVYKSDKTKEDDIVLYQSIPTGSIIDEQTVISLEVNKKTISTIPNSKITSNDISVENNIIIIDTKNTNSTINIKLIDSTKSILFDQDFNKVSDRIAIDIPEHAEDYIEIYIDSNLILRHNI